MLDCFVVRRKTQRAAMANTTCCDGQHNVLHLATQRAAFGNATCCIWQRSQPHSKRKSVFSFVVRCLISKFAAENVSLKHNESHDKEE